MTAKKNNKAFVAFIVLAFLVLGVGIYATLPAPEVPVEDASAVVTEEVVPAAGVAEDAAAGSETAFAETPVAEATSETAASETPVADDSGFDLEAIKGERILGNPSAPIKIIEFASLTCPHCADFHTQTLGQVKAELIDTGKAYIVFSDFPLNAPALHATMAARCLPQDKYYDFTSELFAEQEKWAGDANYIVYLRDKAATYGLPADRFKACVENKEIQQSIIDRMEASQKMWQIKSTPSFVVNNKTLISGELPPEEFIKQVNDAVAAPAAAPETKAAE